MREQQSGIVVPKLLTGKISTQEELTTFDTMVHNELVNLYRFHNFLKEETTEIISILQENPLELEFQDMLMKIADELDIWNKSNNKNQGDRVRILT